MYARTVDADRSETRASRLRVGSIVVRGVRFQQLLAFWQAALGYEPREPPQDGWVVLTDPTGTGPNLSLERVEADRLRALDELSRVHLDLYTPDQHEEVERLLELGAIRYDRSAGPDDDFVVLVDPDGNRFCVVAKTDEAHAGNEAA